jgi:hypothetical protein
MSIKLMAEVWTRELPHAEQSILLAMADHADDEGGSVFPSVGLVAWKTGYSKRQVQRIIADLKTRGALVLVATAVRYRANEYQIDLGVVPVKAPFRDDRMTSLDETGATSEASGATQLGHPRDDTALSSRTIMEPSLEPPLKSKAETSPSAPTEPTDEDQFQDRPAPNPNDRQVYFVGRLMDHDEGWKSLSFGGVVGLNKKFGRPVVTEALGRMWEEAQAGSAVPKKPFALVREVCSQIVSDSMTATVGS